MAEKLAPEKRHAFVHNGEPPSSSTMACLSPGSLLSELGFGHGWTGEFRAEGV
jgi:hypothetical protein